MEPWEQKEMGKDKRNGVIRRVITYDPPPIPYHFPFPALYRCSWTVHLSTVPWEEEALCEHNIGAVYWNCASWAGCSNNVTGV